MVAVSFTLEATDGVARAGCLHTPHGSVATPCFMAVGTCGGLKGVTAEQAEQLGQGIILGNTYHLALRPGCETVHALGGLHSFAGWQGPMLTDSGGYQVFSLASQRKLSEDGVTFASHIDGQRLHLSPEESLRIQRFLGADIVMAFDECPAHDAPAPAHQDAVERTLRWLDRSTAAWRDQTQGWPRGAPVQALYGIVQGGPIPELRQRAGRETVARDLPGYAIGGLAVGESAAERNAALEAVCPVLPANRPRYLMGVGTPLDLIEAIARGCDQFDCVLPTRMGRHGIAYTDHGPLHLMRAQYRQDRQPICMSTHSSASRHSRGYVRHLLKSGEPLGGVLVSLHNLAYYQQLLRRVRNAIIHGEFSAFYEEFCATYQAKSADC